MENSNLNENQDLTLVNNKIKLSINQSINSNKQTNNREDMLSKGRDILLEASTEKLVQIFVKWNLIPEDWIVRHIQIAERMGRDKYMQLGVQARKYGKDPGRLFTYLINQELKYGGK